MRLSHTLSWFLILSHLLSSSLTRFFSSILHPFVPSLSILPLLLNPLALFFPIPLLPSRSLQLSLSIPLSFPPSFNLPVSVLYPRCAIYFFLSSHSPFPCLHPPPTIFLTSQSLSDFVPCSSSVIQPPHFRASSPFTRPPSSLRSLPPSSALPSSLFVPSFLPFIV